MLVLVFLEQIFHEFAGAYFFYALVVMDSDRGLGPRALGHPD